MTSIEILKSNLEIIEGQMRTIEIEIAALLEEANEKIVLRDDKILKFNALDEKTVEIKEDIELLKTIKKI